MMKISVTHASVKVRYRLMVGGSVLKGTVFCNVEGVDSHLSVESDAPPDRLAHLIRNAKNGCFAEGLIARSVPLSSTIEVNGKPLSIEGITKD
ncbi:MAG: hypothetical protein HYY77_23460 [Betaproteobacteria bacterium]|nr:hypothetical protein [Betaproteobacteria bacterium]